MRKGPIARIRAAEKRASEEIAMNNDGSMYGRGTASEGYAGGYAQALRDVELVLRGVRPGTRGYWQDWEKP